MSNYQFNPNIEQWKEIPGFPGYEVSDHGRVRSYWVKRGRWVRYLSDQPQKFIKIHRNPEGYGLLCLILQGNIHISCQIHRLVLSAFEGPRPLGMQGCHNDGNPSNNLLNNLRWDTPKNNQRDRLKHKTSIRGSQNGNAKITVEQVRKIRQLYALGVFQRMIGELFGLKQVTISDITRRKTWKHID